MEKTARFPNLSSVDRTEVGYATIPFKKGEWKGDPLLIRDPDKNNERIENAWVYPFGAKYDDDSYRYGALLAKLDVKSRQDKLVDIVKPTSKITEPLFQFAKGVSHFVDSSLNLVIRVDEKMYQATFDKWVMREDNGMRKVYESVSRMGGSNFVVDLKIYLYSGQDVAKFELKIYGSNPDNTLRTYPFDDIHLFLVGKGRLNIRAHERRGVETIKPLRHYKLMDGSHGYFGDGQAQEWYGEIFLPNDDEDAMRNALAALEYPFWGMSADWVDCGEAFGPFGHVPKPPVELPDKGLTAVKDKYVKMFRFMNSRGHPWDDYPEGLTKTPFQTGGQQDFGLMKGWDVLWTGMAELVEVYRFLAGEESKRTGHFREADGSQVTHANHPLWITWFCDTHYSSVVSRDRLGKTDRSAPHMSNGWVGKDWEHFSSNLLYIASLLTGSYQLRDEQHYETEAFLAGHTVPSKFPNWSTNSRWAPRGFGRTHVSLTQHYTILDRQDILDLMLLRFKEVIKDQWDGATRSPVKNWDHVVDARVIPNTKAWVPWNEYLGFPGMVALYNLTEQEDIKQFIIDWGTSLIKYSWQIERDANKKIEHLEIGGGIKWHDSGKPITPAQYFDRRFFRFAQYLKAWSPQVPQYVMRSDWFDADTRALAKEIFDKLHEGRMRWYDPIRNPFDDFGQWAAI